MGGLANRNSLIIKKSRGKRVLDLGCIGFHNPTIDPYPPVDWLHKKIVETSSGSIGVDIEKDKVEHRVKQGYDIAFGQNDRGIIILGLFKVYSRNDRSSNFCIVSDPFGPRGKVFCYDL